MWQITLLSMFPLMPLLLAWRQWARHDDRSLPRRRRGLWMLGLCLISFGLLVYVAFGVQTGRIHGWFDHQDEMFVWIRAGGWPSLLGFLFTLFGGGKSRIWGAVSGLLVAGLWFLVASIPP